MKNLLNIFLIILITALFWVQPANSLVRFYGFTSIADEGTGVDEIDGNNLTDGALGFLILPATQDLCIYVNDADSSCGSTSSESPCPRYIQPDTNPGTNCWELTNSNSKIIRLLVSALSDHTGHGIVSTMTVDVNTYGEGSCLHLDIDGNYIEADADSVTTMPCSALAIESGTGTKQVLYQGFMQDETWNWTVGGWVYVMSGTDGTLTQTAPSASGDYVQKVGIATHADRIYFDPDFTMVKIN